MGSRLRVAALFLATICAAQQPPSLQINPSSLSFRALYQGDATDPQVITLTSSNLSPLRFTVRADNYAGGVPQWLQLRPLSGTTPARLVLSVDPATLAAGRYTAQLIISVVQSTLPPIIVPLTLAVDEAPPSLDVFPDAVRVFARQQSPNPVERVVWVRNRGGGGPINFTFAVQAQKSWVGGSGQGQTRLNGAVPLRFQIDPRGLSPGAYRGILRFGSQFGTPEVPMTLFIAGGGPVLGVQPDGLQFEVIQGNGTSLTRSLTIFNRGSDTLNWTAQIAQGKEWLALSASQGSVASGSNSSVDLSVSNNTLTADVYYALIRISAPGALHAPQLIPLVLNVLPANTPQRPALFPPGLFFAATVGSPPPNPQAIRVYSSNQQGIAYQAGTSTLDSSGWLSISNTGGVSSTQRPGTINVSVDHIISKLSPGLYTGEITVALSGADLRTVNIALLVLPSAGQAAQKSAAGCTPTRLVALHTGLESNFTVAAGWPLPLVVRVADECGDPAANAQVTASFSNGDPPLVLQLNNAQGGAYTATWAPRSVGQNITVTARALAPGLNPATAIITGGVNTNKAPIMNPGGIGNNLHSVIGAALAPGVVAAVFGESLAGATLEPGVVPLRTSASGSSVLISGVEAPLYFISPGQINLQIPAELAPDQQHQLIVSANGAFTLPETITLAPVNPGVAAFADGRIIAQHGADFSLITVAAPARPGEHVILYLVGMGVTDPAVPSGQPAPSDFASLAKTRVQPTVTIDGKQATVIFAGLTPKSVGLYQINLLVPPDSRTGDLTVSVSQDGVAANTAVLPVR